MQLAPGWSLNVDRGPDWIFVRLHCDDALAHDATELAEQLWELLQCHLSHRMVVEMDELPRVTSNLLGQLVLLAKRVHGAGGMLRLCGVSPGGEASIRAARLDRLFPHYGNRADAVMGQRPRQPR